MLFSLKVNLFICCNHSLVVPTGVEPVSIGSKPIVLPLHYRTINTLPNPTSVRTASRLYDWARTSIDRLRYFSIPSGVGSQLPSHIVIVGKTGLEPAFSCSQSKWTNHSPTFRFNPRCQITSYL